VRRPCLAYLEWDVGQQHGCELEEDPAKCDDATRGFPMVEDKFVGVNACRKEKRVGGKKSQNGSAIAAYREITRYNTPVRHLI